MEYLEEVIEDKDLLYDSMPAPPFTRANIALTIPLRNLEDIAWDLHAEIVSYLQGSFEHLSIPG